MAQEFARLKVRLLSVILTGLTLSICSFSNTANAMLIHEFDFVEAGTNDVLATIELEGPPQWYHFDLVGLLTFTPEGFAIFGLPNIPGSDFTESNATGWVPDGIGGIREGAGIFDNGIMTDFSPPPSSLSGVAPTLEFSMRVMDDPGRDSLTLEYGSTPNPPFISAFGDWREVPEPSSTLLFGLGVLILSTFRRRENR